MNTLVGEKILITGGTGFIGSYLADLLARENKVVLFDKYLNQNSTLLKMKLMQNPNISLVLGDIMSTEDLNKLDLDFDYVIHAAGLLGIKNVRDNPINTMSINGIGTQLILQAMTKQIALKKFIFFSTSEIYGPESLNVNETDPAIIPSIGIRWNYSCSKLFGEYLVKAYGKEYNLPWIIVRPFNVYGPYRNGSNGMSVLIQHAIQNEEIILSGNGQQKRSWCHVRDFVNGIYACLVKKDIIGCTFNIGNNQNNISMLDLAHKILAITKSHSLISISNTHEEDVRDRRADLSLSESLLNYKPTIGLDEGILSIYDSLQEKTKPMLEEASYVH